MYLSRWITLQFKKNVRFSPVTVLTGARQVGKSTYLLNEFKENWKYISFDDFNVLEIAKKSPLDLLQSNKRLITPKPHIFYWRTRSGVEVDFVIEHGRDLFAIEVKASENVGYYDIKGIEKFAKDFPNMKCGIIIYSGNEFVKLTNKIYAVPLKVLLEGEME